MIVLALFLQFRLALWVAAGIPIALLGTLAVFPGLNIAISTMSIMGFILVIGILVDDAIVVGGGPSGATAANDLALAGHKVMLHGCTIEDHCLIGMQVCGQPHLDHV